MQTAAVSTSRYPSLSGFAATVPGRIVLGLAATAVIAASAHVSIPLPFTPVPLTLQDLSVFGVALAFGPVGGFLTLLAYLAEGAIGLPVFSPTGPGGIAQLLGPTGGFLMSYPLVAAVIGMIAHGLAARTTRFVAAFVACAVALLPLFFIGAFWLMHFAHLSLHATWIAAIAPFLPGQAVKIVVAGGVYSTLTRSPRS